MLTTFINAIKSRPEIAVLLIMVMVIAMLIIPLPKMLVDFLIGLNIVISILMLLLSFYITRILGFTSFRTFADHHTVPAGAVYQYQPPDPAGCGCGNIIQSFGEFVIGENIVVGFVILPLLPWCSLLSSPKGRSVWRKWRHVSLSTVCPQADEY